MMRDVRLLLALDLALLAKERVVLVLLVLLPLLSVPLGYGLQRLAPDMEERSDAVYTLSGPESLRPLVEADPGLRWGEPADATLVVEPEALRIENQDTREGRKARAKLRDLAETWEETQTAARWEASGLPIAPDELVQVKKRDLAREHGLIGAILAQAVLFFGLMSGLYIATDLIAGERERGTMETLLSAPPSQRAMLFAKFLLLFGVVLLMAVEVFASAGLAILTGLLDAPPIGPGGWILATLALVPLSALVAAALFLVGALIPDFRAGQAAALPLLLGGQLLAVAAMFPMVSLNAATALVPITGVSLLLRELMAGQAPPLLTAGTLLAALVEAALAVALTAKTVSREGLLLGARTGRDRHERGEFGREVAAGFLVLLGVFFALGLPAQVADLARGMVVTQIGVFGGFAVLFLVVLGQPLRAGLALGTPRPRDLGLGLGLGLSLSGLGILVDRAQRLVLPIPSSYAEEFAKSLTLDIPLWGTLLLFALLPGIFEEMTFRGAFQGLLQRSMNAGSAAVVVALLFGLMHLDPPRILPVSAIGLLLGLARARSGSLWVSMLAHAINNGLLMTLMVQGGELPEPPLGLAAAMAGVAALSVWAMRGPRPAA